MKYYGDFEKGKTVQIGFNTRTTAGAPATLSGTPVVSVYIGSGTTEITTGVTLSVDHDSRTGYNLVTIVTTNAAYVRNEDYTVVITTGTVDSISVVGVVIGQFSIENRSNEIVRRDTFVGNDIAISTVNSQTSLVLASGPTYNVPNALFILKDANAAVADSPSFVTGSYTASGLIVTLDAAPAFTVTTSDKLSFAWIGSNIVDLVDAPNSTAVTAIQNGLARESINRKLVRLEGTVVSVVGTAVVITPTQGTFTDNDLATFEAVFHDSASGNYIIGPIVIASSDDDGGYLINLASTPTGVGTGDYVTVSAPISSNAVANILTGFKADAVLGTAPGGLVHDADLAATQTTAAAIKAATRSGMTARWTDEDGAYFDLTVTDIP